MSAEDDMAKELTLIQLRGILGGNNDRFERLNWSGVEEEILAAIFPYNDRFGKLHPPETYLSSAEKVRQWRKISKSNQQHEIERAKEQQEAAAKRSNRRRSRGRSRGEENDDDVRINETQEQQYASPPAKVTTTKKRKADISWGEGREEDDNDDNDLDMIVPGGGGASSPSLDIFQSTDPWGREEEAIEMRNFDTCQGISIAIIGNTRVNDLETVIDGFSHLVGNVVRYKGSYLSNNRCEWPYGRDVAGFLVNQNAVTNIEGDPVYSWKCIEVEVDRNTVEYSFRHESCLGTKDAGKPLCVACTKAQYRLYDLCRKEVKLRQDSKEDPMIKGRHDSLCYKSPSIILPHIEAASKQIKVLRTSIWKKEQVVNALSERTIEVSNANDDYIFEEKVLREGYKKMEGKLEVEEKEVFDILFQECKTVKKRVASKGNAKGHSYSPLLIRFAIMLRNNVSQSKYDFFRQAFGLPTNATLCEYRSADTTSEDGIMHETCMQQAIAMHKLGVPRGDLRWHLALSFDSHTIKEMLVYDHHTNRIVGYANDAFEKDVIISEFKRMAEEEENRAAEEKANDSEEVTVEDAMEVDEDKEERGSKKSKTANKKKKEKSLTLGKHYYAFLVQSVTNTGTPVRFIAARYCVANMSHRWLRLKLEYIEAALAFYGFVVCAESFDGASENRSYINNRLTLTFRDLCKELYQKDPQDEELEENWDDLQRRANIALGEGEQQEEEEEEEEHLQLEDQEEEELRQQEEVDENAIIEVTTEDMTEDPQKKYFEDDLPWDEGVAFNHPTVEGAIIVAAADMGHTLKKQRNAMKKSGNEDNARDLHLMGCPINLRMAYDVWLQTPDGDPSNQSDIMFYPKLNKGVFYPTSKSAMRTSDAARAQGNSMREMLQKFGKKNLKAGPLTYDSYIRHCEMTDKWVNVMNANRTKGCELISSPNHRHIFDLLDYVKYLKEWKDSVDDPNLFFPHSTYQDAVWTSFGPVVLARHYLPKHPGHTINQMHLGSDPCESTFNLSRNANPNASKRDTDNIMSNLHGGIVQRMTTSKKSNVGKATKYLSNELFVGKIKRNGSKRQKKK